MACPSAGTLPFEPIDKAERRPGDPSKPRDLLQLANLSLRGGKGRKPNQVEATRLFRLVAEAGDAEAQRTIGNFYSSGRGGLKQNLAEAVNWLRLAMANGDRLAPGLLGKLLQAGGVGVAQNQQEAFELFKIGARREDSTIELLADCYENGKGTAKNLREAERLYKHFFSVKGGGADVVQRLKLALENEAKDGRPAQVDVQPIAAAVPPLAAGNPLLAAPSKAPSPDLKNQDLEGEEIRGFLLALGLECYANRLIQNGIGKLVDLNSVTEASLVGLEVTPLHAQKILAPVTGLASPNSPPNSRPKNSKIASRVNDSGVVHNVVLAPLAGVVKLAEVTIEQACNPLMDLIAELAVFLYLAGVAGTALAAKFNQYGITRDECAAIWLYTCQCDFFVELNRRLRSQDRAGVAPFSLYLSLLIRGIRKLPVYAGIAWRGVELDPEKLAKSGVTPVQMIEELQARCADKSPVFWWSVSSLTNDIHTSLEFSGGKESPHPRIIYQVTTRRGTRIEEFSSLPHEAEILLLPGSCFEVRSVAELAINYWQVELSEIIPPVPLVN